jgi:pimeloyl-ACP methyl ester carboxylesterase
MSDLTGFAEVNGGRLHYEAAGAGPALVMLHGHLLDGGQWEGQFQEFGDRFHVIRYDARGFGRSSEAAPPFTHHEDLLALLDHLDVDRAVLMGCSGGGATSLDFAIAYPDRVSALILVGTGLGGYRFPGPRPQMVDDFNEAIERGEVDRAVELGLRLFTDGEVRRPEQVDPDAREQTRAMMARQFRRPDRRVVARGLDPPAVSRLAEIAVPTLVMVGEHDPAPIQGIADIVVSQVPDARKVVVADAGHHPNLEHPAEFNRAVESFLSSRPAATGGEGKPPG